VDIMASGGKFTLGLVQMACAADPGVNLRQAISRVEEASRAGAGIVCLPELFRSRYFCQREDPAFFDLAEPIPGPTTRALSEVARKLRVVVVAPLFERRAPGVYHNSVAVLDAGGEVAGLYRKIDGINPAPHLRDEEVNRTVSHVSAIPEVREFLVSHLREFLSLDNLVVEGRDIGSIVFPDTPYKFYIDASLEVRAHRRTAQGHSDDLFSRDRVDSSRRASPLIIAEDAHVIDSSSLTIDGVVGEIIGRLKIQRLSAALRLDS